jgi:NAD(P)-dependent dehydrogenase (short-subunit alcohol dehydrogenase family)
MDSLRRFSPWILISFSVPAAYYTARYLWELVTVKDLQNKTVFITGFDTGFGYLLAVKCAREAGMTVFAGCLTEGGRRAIAEENSKFEETEAKAGSGRIITVPLDVSDADSCQAAARFVERNLGEGQCELWDVLGQWIIHCGCVLVHYSLATLRPMGTGEQRRSSGFVRS